MSLRTSDAVEQAVLKSSLFADKCVQEGFKAGVKIQLGRDPALTMMSDQEDGREQCG